MGGNLGCHRSIPKDPTDIWNRRKFSAACSFSHVMVNQERLNINTATEEELMTLPGVNRIVAQNIVEYRGCIGGFKKIQDLALVSGVGANKLEAIKLEICVSSRSSSSQHSPSSIRKDSNGFCHNWSCQSSNGVCHSLNINSATATQLMSLRGLTENIANDIITFRMENGSFKTVEDLLKVPSINISLLENLCLHICVQRSRAASIISSFMPQPGPNTCSESRDQEGGVNQIRQNTDMELLHGPTMDRPPGGPWSRTSVDLPPGGPAQIPWSRPSVDLLSGLEDLKPVLTLATWNLQSCSIEKANNPGVREVLCMTLLEKRISLLAVQDVLDPDTLDKFCMELNDGRLSCFRRWKSPRGVWKSVVSDRPTNISTNQRKSFCGFMWDVSSGVDLKEAANLESTVVNGNGSEDRPGLYSAVFTVGDNDLRLINVHLPLVNEESGANNANSTNGASSGAQQLLSILQDTLRDEKELLVLGDFGCSPQASQLELLRREKMCALVPSSRFTNISTSSPQGTCCLDNIWISKSLKKLHTGRCDVVREGLTNPWIPDNWSWGGVASDHCPIVTALYLDPRPKAPPLSQPGVTVDRCEAQDKLER